MQVLLRAFERSHYGKFGPLWSEKLKRAFHQFHPNGLLEE